MKKIFLLIGVILVASCSPLKKYADTKKPHWEKEVLALEALDKTESYSEDAILFIGSSSIRIWKNIKEDLAPYEPIRRGYGGAHFYDLIHYVDRLVTPHDVRGVGVFVANDIAGSDNDLTPEEAFSLFKFTVKRIQKLKPGVPIFPIAITPTPSRWSVYPATKRLNDLIQDYSKRQEGLYFIETASQYIIDGSPRPELFTKDMLHMNQEGYDLWSSIIKTELDKVYK